jgi:diguanylate cyclase (GGDEF)-like protein/PAS domain S-box-containing protein
MASVEPLSLLNKVSAMLGYWDQHLCSCFASDAYAMRFGLTPGQMQGKHAREVMGEAAYLADAACIEAALRGEAQTFERTSTSALAQDALTFLTEFVPDFEDGVVCGFAVQVTDISHVKRAHALAEGSTKHVKAILDNLFAYVALLDVEGRVLEVNKAPLERAGFRREDVIGQYFFDAPWWTHREEVRLRIIQSIELARQGNSDRFDIVARMGDELQPLDFMISPVRDEQGTVVGLIPTAVDITYRKKVEADLRIAATAFNSKSGILVTDAEGNILRANQAFLDATGYTQDEILGENPRLFKSDRHAAEFYVQMWNSLLTTGSWEGEVWDRCKSGKLIFKALNITTITNDDGAITHYVSTQTDITARRMAEEAIEQLAFFDPLTELPNRRLLGDRLRQAQASYARSGKEGAILFIDLDNFKSLNDTQGHDVGDLLLVQVAQRLKACVREGDTVARLGGDEYVVMIESLSEDPVEAATQAKAVGKKILDALNKPYLLLGQEHRNTPSIGVTLLNNQHHSIDEMLKQADIAMYQAKKSGRNTLRFFDPQMQDAINTRVSVEKELHAAIEQCEFALHYQAQVNAQGAICGAEALIRWMHPTRGVVMPGYFIALAEETGLIVPIGAWVIDAACAQLQSWQARGVARGLVIAVNVSAKQMQHEDFVSQVKASVHRHSIPANLLKLELTESMLVDNVEETIAKIEALRSVGIQFSLDDFGTGFCSLQYLKKMPLDQLKIDQSFVRGIEGDRHDRSIVRTVIAIAKSLELDVIAEGVETKGQLEVLQAEGCNSYQGYLFAKPVPLEQFEALLSTRLPQPHQASLQGGQADFSAARSMR